MTTKQQAKAQWLDIKDLSGQAYRFDGKNEGTINGEEYLSTTEGEFGADGILRCKFITHKLPPLFIPAYLSLSNASSKSSMFASPLDEQARNFFSVMSAEGIVRSARIYTFPDYPNSILSQVGTATLSAKGIYYHTFINGFTEGIPTDIVAIRPYTQIFRKQADGSLHLSCDSELICESGDIVASKIIGQFTFDRQALIPSDFAVRYAPKFTREGNVTHLEMPVSIQTL